MNLTREDVQSLHMTFGIVNIEMLLSEESKIWLKDFKERLINFLEEDSSSEEKESIEEREAKAKKLKEDFESGKINFKDLIERASELEGIRHFIKEARKKFELNEDGEKEQ